MITGIGAENFERRGREELSEVLDVPKDSLQLVGFHEPRELSPHTYTEFSIGDKTYFHEPIPGVVYNPNVKYLTKEKIDELIEIVEKACLGSVDKNASLDGVFHRPKEGLYVLNFTSGYHPFPERSSILVDGQTSKVVSEEHSHYNKPRVDVSSEILSIKLPTHIQYLEEELEECSGEEAPLAGDSEEMEAGKLLTDVVETTSTIGMMTGKNPLKSVEALPKEELAELRNGFRMAILKSNLGESRRVYDLILQHGSAWPVFDNKEWAGFYEPRNLLGTITRPRKFEPTSS